MEEELDVMERDVMERLAFSTYDEEENGARTAMQWPSPTGFNMMQRQVRAAPGAHRRAESERQSHR